MHCFSSSNRFSNTAGRHLWPYIRFCIKASVVWWQCNLGCNRVGCTTTNFADAELTSHFLQSSFEIENDSYMCWRSKSKMDDAERGIIVTSQCALSYISTLFINPDCAEPNTVMRAERSPVLCQMNCSSPSMIRSPCYQCMSSLCPANHVLCDGSAVVVVVVMMMTPYSVQSYSASEMEHTYNDKERWTNRSRWIMGEWITVIMR